VGTIMASNGFEVVDLGVNVDHQDFVMAIKEHNARLVGLSCLLTTVFEDVKKTVQAIEEAGLRDQVTIMVGGGPADQALIDYAGADVYCRTAQDGVEAARQALGVK
jgi:dimethylamine corrinoid protein